MSTSAWVGTSPGFLARHFLGGILLVTFALARLIPGDPCRAILGEKATEEVCARFIQERGLDKPILTQFGIYIVDMTRGNFGESFRLGMPVTRLLIERLPTTFELSLPSPRVLVFSSSIPASDAPMGLAVRGLIAKAILMIPRKGD